ncbi:HXXEE domain-containing protein [Rhizobium sp. NZLR1]|uniref:HXXEE domain-containing protein n=1 Tax=Rhizobium sp. NZLR1 TaxID=2731096 RepID=UPI001A991CC2|nr:HXXEE domain-containing protein [Rhizobium sp. NZLR1]MBX5204685.1 HXXEE domain-containing protein [Rhizobium sp. NZLR1]QSZ23398.1 HXXEE domain-containing protein [Rhizobium sp. NZLR1]
MPFGWFDMNWPWIGLFIAAILLVVLFGTDALRGERSVSRWRDPRWLAWLAPAGYMLHQTEEYGVDMLGQFFAFPNLVCATFGQPPYPDCAYPPSLYVAINIPVIWIAGLICALLSRRYPLVGLGLYGVHFVNALSHIGMFAATGDYNPGVLTAFVVLLPLSVWVAFATWKNPLIGRSGIATIFLAGLLVNGVLAASLVAFSRGLISGDTLIGIQLFNFLWSPLIPWLKDGHSQQGRR